MKRKWLMIGINILVMVLLVLGSLSNVVGYQSVQTTQQSTIKERINQRELLFQTIVDIANNKEIQQIILKSQMSRGIFPPSEIPIVTKNQIRQMYLLGLILSKVISRSRMQSIIGKYQFNNQEMQKEINGVIEKDYVLKSNINQLSCSNCSIGKTWIWQFPVICSILFVPYFICMIWLIAMYGQAPDFIKLIFVATTILAAIFQCPWYW
jgi:hypothetical protein